MENIMMLPASYCVMNEDVYKRQVVDFRNYNYGLDQLIADNGYDQILVLYSFDSFKSDPYLYRAGAAG